MDCYVVLTERFKQGIFVNNIVIDLVTTFVSAFMQILFLISSADSFNWFGTNYMVVFEILNKC